jgi:3-hydroxyacyl-[acyl-carrier-protein] dehydratase
LLDTIVEVAPGAHARAERMVTTADPLLRDDACLSETLLIEAMAQCAGVASATGRGDTAGGLVAIDRLQVHGAVVAGDRLTLEAHVVKKMGPMVKVHVTARVGADLRAEGQLVLRLGALSTGHA